MDRETQRIFNELSGVVNAHAAQIAALSAIVACVPEKEKISEEKVMALIDQATQFAPFGSGDVRGKAKTHAKSILSSPPKSP